MMWSEALAPAGLGPFRVPGLAQTLAVEVPARLVTVLSDVISWY